MFIHLAVVVFVGFQIYEISRNSKRVWAYSRSIQGHRSWCQSREHNMSLPIGD